MNQLKRIDFYGQLALLLASTILLVVKPSAFLRSTYITVGSWQFLSSLIHYLRRSQLLRQKSRHFFEAILVAVPVAVLTCILFPFVLDTGLPILIWVSPLLAVWYCYITYIEMQIWDARALIQLR